jgi:hypothetical protein
MNFIKQQQKQVNKFILKEFIEQSKKNHKCREILNAELNRMAADAMKELMNDNKTTVYLFLPSQNVLKNNKKKKSRWTSKQKQKMCQLPLLMKCHHCTNVLLKEMIELMARYRTDQ